jgi:LPXTG-motif cell wall-anchored protein
MSGTPAAGSSAYQAGQSGAVIFGALMLVAGLYYFFRKPG